ALGPKPESGLFAVEPFLQDEGLVFGHIRRLETRRRPEPPTPRGPTLGVGLQIQERVISATEHKAHHLALVAVSSKAHSSIPDIPTRRRGSDPGRSSPDPQTADTIDSPRTRAKVKQSIV